MFYDALGNWLYPRGDLFEARWRVSGDSEAIPSWLTQVGTATVATPVINGFDGDRGYARFLTKASPAAGNFGGLATAQNLDTAEFQEIGFYIEGWASDSNDGAIHNLSLQLSDGAGGCFLQNNHSASPAGATQLRVYTPTAVTMPWELVNNNNGTRRKRVGIVIRPPTREVWVFAGDPRRNAGIIHVDKGNWVDPAPTPIQWRIFTQNTVQRYMEFNALGYWTVAA